MRKSLFTEEQIVALLREAEKSEKSIEALCREKGVTAQTFYRWRRKYGGVDAKDLKHMKVLERERALKQAGQVTASSDPQVVEFRGADYFLTGKLGGLTTRTSQGTSDYILYSFQLIDARTSEIVWEDSHEIKKQGLEDAAYR